MIEDLLIDFDEMGFAPTPICGINPEEYARKWKSELVSEVERLKAENETYCKQINQAYDTGYDDGYGSGKEDGVREFAEELKAKTMCITEYEDGTRILQTSNKLIDQSVNIFLTNL